MSEPPIAIGLAGIDDDCKQLEKVMETHAQHLHNVPGKKLWHYFYEFLMLFLAIFCGFLAENFREHKVDEEKGHQYVYSFREDLIKDTVECTASIQELTETTAALDNLVPCFNEVDKDRSATNCLKNIITHSWGFKDFIYTDRTIQQLKNAGGLRLIDDKEIADSIIDYDATIRGMQIHQAVLENLQQLARNSHNNEIDFTHLEKLIHEKKTDTLFLLSKDRSELNRYFNVIRDFKGGLVLQLDWMQYIKWKATRLLEMLKKKGIE